MNAFVFERNGCEAGLPRTRACRDSKLVDYQHTLSPTQCTTPGRGCTAPADGAQIIHRGKDGERQGESTPERERGAEREKTPHRGRGAAAGADRPADRQSHAEGTQSRHRARQGHRVGADTIE